MKIRLLKNSLIDNSLELTFSLYQHPLFYRMCSNETSQKISAKKKLAAQRHHWALEPTDIKPSSQDIA
jgi:hypothetical protein